jgi:hypothetical protein
VALAKRTYSPDAGGEVQALLNLMDRVDLDWVSVKAEALHAKEFVSVQGAGRLISNIDPVKPLTAA